MIDKKKALIGRLRCSVSEMFLFFFVLYFVRECFIGKK